MQIPLAARTLEAAMQIEEAMTAVLDVAKVRWNVKPDEPEEATRRRRRRPRRGAQLRQ